ncbi:hypothetical protein FSP39_011161 [Pinctada imbricata]|uniref:Receptor ligand binding region domain-containing protein n=1 Tax=Pinctada imbricata TaxID=66713 RepID=A0AA89BZH0_PINIB|nr:hypothetical protein FSP39_011161 [Pinctada imbricata]
MTSAVRFRTIYGLLVLSLCLFMVSPSQYCYDPGTGDINGFCTDKSVSSPGDVRVIVLASVHEPGPNNSCGQFSSDVFQSIMAVDWIIDILNGQGSGNDSFIPGVKIGYDVFDDCGVPSFATDSLLHALPYGKPRELLSCTSSCDKNETPIAGVVTVSSADVLNTALETLPQHVPVITSRAPLSSEIRHDAATFSTVPSLDEEFQAMIKVMNQAKWSIISIIYSDDMLGRHMNKIFKSYLDTTDICVIFTTSMTFSRLDNDHLQDIYLSLGGKQIQQESEFLGVVYLGHPSLIASLLDFLSARQTNVHKLEWLLPSFIAENTHVKSSVNKFTQNNVMLVASPYQRKILDFEKYATRTIEESTSSPKSSIFSPWIEKYIQENNINNNFHQQPHVYPVIKSILSLAAALKVRYSSECSGDQIEPCSKFLGYIQNNGISKDLKSINSTVFSSSSFPDELKNLTLVADTYLIKFVEDAHLQISKPSSNSNGYERIGTLEQGELQISSPLPTSPSRCGLNKNCSTCVNDEKLRYAYIPGDVLILGLFSVRDEYYQNGVANDLFRCGEYRSSSITVMTISSFLHSIETLNKMQSNRGVTFGGIALDDCYSPHNITVLLTNLFTKREYLVDPDSGALVDFDRVIAVVGALSSKVSLIVADLMTSLRIPMISYGASSAGLDDRVRYPYFLRTVPSDTLQVAGLVGVLKEMNFTHVGAIYIDDPYGLNGIQAFKEMATANGICVEEEKTISEKSTKTEIETLMDDIYRQLNPDGSDRSGRKVNPVLFYSIDTIAQNILEVLKESTNEKKFTFVASEAWGTNVNLVSGQLGEASAGSLVFVTNTSFNVTDTFEAWLRNVTILTTTKNPWLRQYLAGVFDCDIEGTFRRTKTICREDQHLHQTKVDSISSDQRVVHVIHSVYAVREGFLDTCGTNCASVVGFRTTDVANRFTSYLKNVEMTDSSGKGQRLFTDDGNGFNGFNIYNIKETVKDGQYVYEYEKVGDYTKSNFLRLDKSKIKLYRSGKPPTPIEGDWIAPCIPTRSSCAAICPIVDTTPVVTQPTTIATTEEPSVDQMMIIISALGAAILVVLLVVLFVAVLICRQNKNKIPMSPGVSQHSVVSQHPSVRSANMYDSPRSQYSSIANLKIGRHNESFEMEDRAASASSGIVPGSSNVSNGTAHKLELPVEYSGLMAPEAHKFGSKQSVNSYLAPNQAQNIPKITISRDDSLIRRPISTPSPPLARSQSEGDVSEDKSALNYMTAKDLQMEDEDLSYLSSPHTSPTSMGSHNAHIPAPRRMLPSIDHVNNIISQSNAALPRHQRPTTLPGIKAHIIPPENPPPYHVQSKHRVEPHNVSQNTYLQNENQNFPTSLPANNYSQPTISSASLPVTNMHSLPVAHSLAGQSSSGYYIQPTSYPSTSYNATAQQSIPPINSQVPYLLVTETGEIISPVSNLPKQRTLPSVPYQEQTRMPNAHLQQQSEFPPTSVYNSSNIDSLDRYGIHFENPAHPYLYQSHPSTINGHSSDPLTHHSLAHVPMSGRSNSAYNQGMLPQPDVISGTNRLNNVTFVTQNQNLAASPVMYATTPRLPSQSNTGLIDSRNPTSSNSGSFPTVQRQSHQIPTKDIVHHANLPLHTSVSPNSQSHILLHPTLGQQTMNSQVPVKPNAIILSPTGIEQEDENEVMI